MKQQQLFKLTIELGPVPTRDTDLGYENLYRTSLVVAKNLDEAVRKFRRRHATQRITEVVRIFDFDEVIP